MKKPSIGPISEGTLRNQDLIPTFLDVLFGLNESSALIVRNNYPEYFDIDDEDDEWWDSEEAAAMYEDLEAALDECSPPYCYFGVQEGDGACFGFWPQDLREIVDFNSEVIKANAGSEPEYVLSVNDHGNVTLYKINLEEVWSIV